MSAEPLRVDRWWRARRAAGRRCGRGMCWFQSELPHGDLRPAIAARSSIRFERIVPAVAEGGREALGARAAAGRHGAADDERLSGQRPAFQRVAGRARAGGERARRAVALRCWRTTCCGSARVGVEAGDPQPAAARGATVAWRSRREDGLAGLPRGAVIHGAELPRVDSRAAARRSRSEVFAQWIDPANLALLDERDRTLVLVLAFTGFRVSSVVTLMRDALELGSDGHPYLRYFNVKLQPRGDAADPAAARRAARAPRGATWPTRFRGTEWLFPSPVHRGAVARRVSHQPEHGRAR